jgi:palmitoyltransferase
MMTATQLQLLSTALTTIESYSIASQRDRERAALARQFGFCGYRSKVKTRKRWEREWGKIATEGNRWWIGGSGREIRQTMGDDPLGWICEWSASRALVAPIRLIAFSTLLVPVGRPKGDGVNFEQNPRFGPGGIRRRREEWPESLR